MAESKFLPFQDVDGDGFNDSCKEEVRIEDVKECPTCTPDPNAIIPIWYNLTEYEPYFNGRECQYQITITTTESNTGYTDGMSDSEAQSALNNIYDAYSDQAIEFLLLSYDKNDTEGTRSFIKENLEYTDYYLDPRQFSKLKLLYSVPIEVLDAIGESDSEEESETEAGDIEFTYSGDEIAILALKIRKGLSLYNRYYKAYQFTQEESLRFLDDDRVFNLGNYGDFGFGNSSMKSLIDDLGAFFSKYNYSIPGTDGLFLKGRNVVTEATFTITFDQNLSRYVVKKIEFFYEACGSKPIVWGQKRCNDLNSKQAWKDQTAVYYFSRMKEMETDLTAREPLPWLDFVIKHTFPEVYSAGGDNLTANLSAGSCIASALAEEGKQLGQDILDDVFGIGDAIAYKFHESLCKSVSEAKRENRFTADLDFSLEVRTLVAVGNLDEAEQNMKAMALEQAYAELEQGKQPFLNLCDTILIGGSSSLDKINFISCFAGGSTGSSTDFDINQLWELGLDDIKLCGLYDALIDVINCLMSGLTLEESLSKITESALRGMSVTNFGDLFVGLPPDKQAELDALVKQKLESGDIFKEGSTNQEISDAIAAGNISALPPWEDNDAGSESLNDTTGANSSNQQTQQEKRTLASQLDPASAANKLSSSIVLEAYIQAMLEVYGNNLLELVDELNRFPGARLISNIIALVDCPVPPLFEPSIIDFIKEIDLPFCENIDDLTFPNFQNPFVWLPLRFDLTASLFAAIRCTIQVTIMKILIKLIVKICQTLGNATCNRLELAGDILSNSPQLSTGRQNLVNLIRESICGENAASEDVDNTIIDMVASLGVGSAALANTEQTLQFAEDVSSSLTQAELTQLILGQATDETLSIIDSLIEYEYPDYRSTIPNRQAIGSFFGNMGKLMPADFRDSLDQSLGNILDDSPANPSICLDPALVENFCETRFSILEGRASPEQISQMCDNSRGLEDLGDFANVLDCISKPDGIACYLQQQMPPLVSDPGCNNGIIPYESEVASQSTTFAIGGDFEQLQVDYSKDMIGNGPGEDNWGLINMMLSDTMGIPLTAHTRRAILRPNYVDGYGTFSPTDAQMAAIFLTNPLLGLALTPFIADFQRGAFPTKVAAYLQEEMNDIGNSITTNINNEVSEEEQWSLSLKELGMDGIFGSVDLLGIPDLGYNVDVQPIESDGKIEEVQFTYLPRKAEPDLSFTYYDNAKGLKATDESDFSWGFELQSFFGDLALNESGSVENIFSDNVRIRIYDYNNQNAKVNEINSDLIPPVFEGEDDEISSDAVTSTAEKKDPSIITDLKYEFIGVDNTLTRIAPNGDSMELYLNDNYPSFIGQFGGDKPANPPQSTLFKEMLEMKNDDSITISDVNKLRAQVIKQFSKTVFTTISDYESDQSAWNYGAQFENLTEEDTAYGINQDGEWVPYADTGYSNRDMILGISYDQYKNDIAETPDKTRIFYLDPAKYGGNYVSPPLYIKPQTPEGWMGVVDVFFPELSACKPQIADVVNFESIQDMIDEIYPNIPEDERLKYDEDCIVELPYNRVMTRAAKASMQGLIMAATRIFISASMIKTLPTFSRFAPKFPQIFSSVYASFIVENMEKSFRDVKNPPWEIFNLFSDDEFWYSFLEQSVQTYAYLVDIGKIEAPPEVLDALFRLNDLQEEYEYPYKEERKEAVEIGEINRLTNLKNYRQKKNLEAVRDTEEDAKLILTDFVVQQLNEMGKNFMVNLKRINLEPDILDLDYYIFEKMCQGSTLTLNESLNVDGTYSATNGDLPTIPYEENEEVEEPYYTNGAQLTVSESNEGTRTVGQEYIGYYHVHIDSTTGLPIYMAGEYHDEEASQDILTPFANIVEVKVGDVPEYGSGFSYDQAQPFALQKYISINGERYSPTEASSEITSNENLDLLISEVYPGDMRLIEDESGNAVGIEGKLGVRYGLAFGTYYNGIYREITSVEIDALDLPLSDFKNLTGDSLNLLCLINHLKKDKDYILASQYVFGFNKLVAIAAIYNDVAMLPSIGEVTVEKGQTFKRSLDFDFGGKPGVQITTTEVNGIEIEKFGEPTQTQDIFGNITEYEATAPDGAWASYKDRAPGLFGGIGVLEWDNWDQDLLKNSTYRIKKLFKNYYNSRDFDNAEFGNQSSPAQIEFKKLREALRPAPGKRLLPWWKRRKLRTNPFDANGNLCD